MARWVSQLLCSSGRQWGARGLRGVLPHCPAASHPSCLPGEHLFAVQGHPAWDPLAVSMHTFLLGQTEDATYSGP